MTAGNHNHRLQDFSALWDTDYDDVVDFIDKKKQNPSIKQEEKLGVVKDELKAKDFELQKAKWQLSEREKELSQLYTEVNKLIELNRKLNTQLEDFRLLETKYQQILERIGKKESAILNFLK